MPDKPLSITPVPHNEYFPIPVPTQVTSTWKYRVRMMILKKGEEKNNAKQLAFRLIEWNLLQPGVKTFMYQTRYTFSIQHFTAHKPFCLFSDAMGLFQIIGITLQPEQWRQFIDCSAKSLKTVLLYHGYS